MNFYITRAIIHKSFISCCCQRAIFYTVYVTTTAAAHGRNIIRCFCTIDCAIGHIGIK
jgi:hypothetical protein